MKINIDENNYIMNYCIIGDLENSIETDFYDFEHPCNYYKYINNEIIFDKEKMESIELKNLKEELRNRREVECFNVINRGELWYNTLTQDELEILKKWYEDWLKVTETLIVPEKPSFIK